MNFLRRLSDGKSQPSRTPIHLARGRGFTFEIVGESYCQDALNRLCGGKCEEGHKLLTVVDGMGRGIPLSKRDAPAVTDLYAQLYRLASSNRLKSFLCRLRESHRATNAK